MKIIGKTEFVAMVSKDNNTTKAELDRNFNIIVSGIEKILSEGNKLSIQGFGMFYVSRSKERVGRNPRTGEALKIKASNAPKFKAGSKLKEACNK